MANIIKSGGGGQKFKKILRQIATQARNVLSGTYFVNSEGEVTEGTIPVHDDYQISETVSSTRIGADTYVSLDSLPEGYYHASSVETENWAPAARANVTNFGNAAVENVLTGKTFTSSAGLRATGTMPDMTKVDSTIGGINSNYPNVPIRKGQYLQVGTTTKSKETLVAIQVPKGYYDGGYVGVAATELGTVTRDQVLNGKTFSSNIGVKWTGTMTNNGALGTKTIAPGGSYTIPGGYTSGGTVRASGVTVTSLKVAAGRRVNFSYTFTDAYNLVIITVGGVDAPSITSGSNWVDKGHVTVEQNGSNTSYTWYKTNVKKNESVTISMGDRYGVSIHGIKW